jgi:uncharacterized protein (TIGR00295 family)
VIPDEGRVDALHRKYGSNSILQGHCKTVAAVADALAEEFVRQGKTVDTDVVHAAAMLHDIGRNRTQNVRHGLEGAEMLEAEGVDQRVVSAVRKHVGAGISVEEAKSLGFPDGDYVPRTIEERIVCFADKMVDTRRVRPFDGEVQRFVKKGHDVKRLLALKRGLQDDLGEDPERVVLDKIKES